MAPKEIWTRKTMEEKSNNRTIHSQVNLKYFLPILQKLSWQLVKQRNQISVRFKFT